MLAASRELICSSATTPWGIWHLVIASQLMMRGGSPAITPRIYSLFCCWPVMEQASGWTRSIVRWKQSCSATTRWGKLALLIDRRQAAFRLSYSLSASPLLLPEVCWWAASREARAPLHISHNVLGNGPWSLPVGSGWLLLPGFHIPYPAPPLLLFEVSWWAEVVHRRVAEWFTSRSTHMEIGFAHFTMTVASRLPCPLSIPRFVVGR